MFVAGLAAYHGIVTMDIIYIAEGGTYFIVYSYMLLILTTQKLKSNRLNYYRLQRVLKEDFEYVSTAKPSHRYNFYQLLKASFPTYIHFFYFVMLNSYPWRNNVTSAK